MAERKATNKYYPPEWNPEHGSINKFVGQHPLRERARKLNQGILIVRFEMPYNVYCEACNNHIAKGRRYNAEKKAVGNYFSTKIWSFKMRCHHCSAEIEVRTDPEKRDYSLYKGIHRVKAEEWQAEDTNTIKLMDEVQQNEMRSDPMKRLEHLHQDEEFADEDKTHILKLQELRDRLSGNDYERNSELRKSFRTQKKDIESRDKEATQRGLNITLLPFSETDSVAAQNTNFLIKTVTPQQQRSKARRRINASSIFGDNHSIRELQKRKALSMYLDKSMETPKRPKSSDYV